MKGWFFFLFFFQCLTLLHFHFQCDAFFICIKSKSLYLLKSLIFLIRTLKHFGYFFWNSIAMFDDVDDPGFEVKIWELWLKRVPMEIPMFPQNHHRLHLLWEVPNFFRYHCFFPLICPFFKVLLAVWFVFGIMFRESIMRQYCIRVSVKVCCFYLFCVYVWLIYLVMYNVLCICRIGLETNMSVVQLLKHRLLSSRPKVQNNNRRSLFCLELLGFISHLFHICDPQDLFLWKWGSKMHISRMAFRIYLTVKENERFT